MIVTAVTAKYPRDLILDVTRMCGSGWKVQGGLAFGDGQWAVLLVKEKGTEEQQPFSSGRRTAYQRVETK